MLQNSGHGIKPGFRLSKNRRGTEWFLRSPTRKSRNTEEGFLLNLFAFILNSHVQALKHTRCPSDIQRPPPSYCGYPRVHRSRIDVFSSIRMNGTRETVHSRYKT